MFSRTMKNALCAGLILFVLLAVGCAPAASAGLGAKQRQDAGATLAARRTSARLAGRGYTLAHPVVATVTDRGRRLVVVLEGKRYDLILRRGGAPVSESE